MRISFERSGSVPTATRSRPRTGRPCWLLDWPSGSPRGAATAFVANRPPCALRALGSSPDGKWWASAGANGTVLVHDASTGATSQTLAADIARTNAVSFSPDGQWLASGGLDNDVHVWDAQLVAKGRDIVIADARYVWPCLVAGFDSCSWSPASRGRSPRSRAGSWTVARASEPLQFVLTEIAVSPDGKTIAVGGFDPLLREAACRGSIPGCHHVEASGTTFRRPARSEGSPSVLTARRVLGVVDGQKGIAVWPVE